MLRNPIKNCIRKSFMTTRNHSIFWWGDPTSTKLIKQYNIILKILNKIQVEIYMNYQTSKSPLSFAIVLTKIWVDRVLIWFLGVEGFLNHKDPIDLGRLQLWSDAKYRQINLQVILMIRWSNEEVYNKFTKWW